MLFEGVNQEVRVCEKFRDTPATSHRLPTDRLDNKDTELFGKNVDCYIRLPIDLEGEFGKILYVVNVNEGYYSDKRC